MIFQKNENIHTIYTYKYMAETIYFNGRPCGPRVSKKNPSAYTKTELVNLAVERLGMNQSEAHNHTMINLCLALNKQEASRAKLTQKHESISPKLQIKPSPPKPSPPKPAPTKPLFIGKIVPRVKKPLVLKVSDVTIYRSKCSYLVWVCGNTEPHREYLQSLGGLWRPEKNCWLFNFKKENDLLSHFGLTNTDIKISQKRDP